MSSSALWLKPLLRQQGMNHHRENLLCLSFIPLAIYMKFHDHILRCSLNSKQGTWLQEAALAGSVLQATADLKAITMMAILPKLTWEKGTVCETHHQMPVTIYAKELGEIIKFYPLTCNPRRIHGGRRGLYQIVSRMIPNNLHFLVCTPWGNLKPQSVDWIHWLAPNTQTTAEVIRCQSWDKVIKRLHLPPSPPLPGGAICHVVR